MRLLRPLLPTLVLVVLYPTASHAHFVRQQVDSLIGAVISVDPGAKTMTVKIDSGAGVDVKVDDRTNCLRIPPGEKTLAKATTIQFAEIAVGDRVLIHGTKTDNVFAAQRVVVLSAADVAKKRELDLDEWKRRGIGGIVREVNGPAGAITLELRGSASGQVLVTTSTAHFRRYTPGSLRFEDARPSSFAEIGIGDQLRALGGRNTDGNFVADEIVSGSFRTVGVTVTEVDANGNEIRVTTLDQKKPIVVILNADSVLHRISPQVATSIAQRAKGESNKSGSVPPKNSGSPVIDVQQMIDTLPPITSRDIKQGDVLAVTGAIEKDGSRLFAIKLAAGVDLVLKALIPVPGKTQVVRLSAGLPSVFDFSVIPVN